MASKKKRNDTCSAIHPFDLSTRRVIHFSGLDVNGSEARSVQ